MSLDMPRKLPPFVVRERSRHGKVIFYFRRGKGQRVRLPDDLQSKEFEAAYEATLSGKAGYAKRSSETASGTLQWLVERYMESGRWAGLSVATRKQQGLFFKDAIEKAKNPPYRGITRKTMQSAMDARRSTPALANNFMKAMRGLFKWAVKNEFMDTDPTAGIDRFSYKTDGFAVWTIEDAVQFCDRWPVGTKPRLAFELFLASGLRRGDVFMVGPQHLRNGTLHFRASKNRHVISVAVPRFLLATIAATPTGDMAFLTKNNGEPFSTKESFGNWFSARCRDAGLVGKSAHGIRKLSATTAANAGSTTHELMAHFGWSTPAQAEVYTRGADRERLGIRSSERVADHFENVIPRTSQSGCGEKAKKA